MNSFVTFVVIGVVAIFAAASAQQESCGCAPQPTVIQLSCGGGQQNPGQYQAPPPPPPPAYTTTASSWNDYTTANSWDDYTTGASWDEYTTAASWNAPAGEHSNHDDLMNMCEFNLDGYPTSHPPGGWPEGFHIVTDQDGIPHPVAPPQYSLPPNNWDGRMETLGFPMPQPGTPHYNMLMCTPIPVMTGPGK